MKEAETEYRYRDRLWSWEELDKYLDRSYSKDKFSRPTRITLALALVEGEKVLDLGCHVGAYSHYLAQKGHHVVAADVDDNVLKIARRKYSHPNVQIVKVDSDRLDFEDNSFDSALLLEVLEHSLDPRGLVREIHRVIKPGGFLILSVPNAASYHTFGRTLLLDIKSYFRKMESWPEFATDQRDHYFYWDPFTIYRLLNRQGFKYADHRFIDNFKWVNFLAKIFPPLRRISTCFIIKVQKTAEGAGSAG